MFRGTINKILGASVPVVPLCYFGLGKDGVFGERVKDSSREILYSGWYRHKIESVDRGENSKYTTIPGWAYVMHKREPMDPANDENYACIISIDSNTELESGINKVNGDPIPISHPFNSLPMTGTYKDGAEKTDKKFRGCYDARVPDDAVVEYGWYTFTFPIKGGGKDLCDGKMFRTDTIDVIGRSINDRPWGSNVVISQNLWVYPGPWIAFCQKMVGRGVA